MCHNPGKSRFVNREPGTLREIDPMIVVLWVYSVIYLYFKKISSRTQKYNTVIHRSRDIF